jgi:hypothetical protein
MSTNFTASGLITISGSPEASSSYFSVIGLGGIAIAGESTIRGFFSYGGSGSASVTGFFVSHFSRYGSGSANVSYLSTAQTEVSVLYSFPFSFDVYDEFNFSYTFSYDIGDLPVRTFRVVGVDYDNCDYIPFCAIPNGKNRMFQELLATNLTEVCDFLLSVNWTWPIAEIQRSVEPAEAFVVDSSTGLNVFGELPPTTNEFLAVPYAAIPACLPFTVRPTPSVSMGMFSKLINVFVSISSGSIDISGSVGMEWVAMGSGVISISGGAEFLSGYHSYIASGDVTIGDSALLTYSYRSHTASGGISISGEFGVVSPYFSWRQSGSIVTSSNAVVTLKLKFSSSGGSLVYPFYAGVNIFGDAEYPILQSGSGMVHTSGLSIVRRPVYREHMSGGASVAGLARSISPYQAFAGDGAALVSGSVAIFKASYSLMGDDATPVAIGGTADTMDSTSGNFWYTALVQPIATTGTSEVGTNGLRQVASGSINISGYIDTDIYLAPDIGVGVFSEIDLFEVSFSQDFVTTLVATNVTIATACSSCSAIPDTLYFRHNLQNGLFLSDFLKRNGLAIPQSIQMVYSPKTESWQASMHFRGFGGDNSNEFERWQINIDWSCVSQYSENTLSSAMWKFGLYIRRVDESNLDKHETRLLILFPSDDICSRINSYGVDFTFNFHFRDEYVTNEMLVPVDTFTYFDDLGVFKGSYWDANSFVGRVMDTDIVDDVNTIDISSTRPEPQSQFYV